MKVCIAERIDFATADLARIGHRQTQQSIMDWCMIRFGHYRTVRDILPKCQQSHQDRPTHRSGHWHRRQEMYGKSMCRL